MSRRKTSPIWNYFVESPGKGTVNFRFAREMYLLLKRDKMLREGCKLINPGKLGPGFNLTDPFFFSSHLKGIISEFPQICLCKLWFLHVLAYSYFHLGRLVFCCPPPQLGLGLDFSRFFNLHPPLRIIVFF